jgi:hypothetical protein
MSKGAEGELRYAFVVKTTRTADIHCGEKEKIFL